MLELPSVKLARNLARTDRDDVEVGMDLLNRRSRTFVPRSILTTAVGKPTLAAPTKRRTATPKTIPRVLPCEQPLQAQLSGTIAHDGAKS